MLLGNDFLADFSRVAIRYPIELGHQLKWPDIRSRVAVALQAEAHIQRLLLVHLHHLIDASMAAHAAHPGSNVRAVIKKHVIRQLVDLEPRNRLAGFPTMTHRLQARALRLHLRVTVHAGFCPRDRGIRSPERRVTIPAIEAQLAHSVADILGRAYNRTQFVEQRRRMMQKWADYLDKLRVGADVLKLPRRKA